MIRAALFCLAALGLGGCAAQPIYYWGHYEPQLYQTYSKPGKSSPEAQALELQEDIQKAEGKNLRAHPGLHAHLGYLYYQMGKEDLGKKEFETEKKLFPESATFMDWILKQPPATATPATTPTSTPAT